MPKTKFTVLLDEEVAQTTRNAVAYLAGHPLYLTLGEMVENALRAEVTRLAKEHNKGEPFPPGRTKAGRPVSRG